MSKWNKKLFGEVATTSKGRLTLQSEVKEQDFLPLINTDAVNGKPSLYGYSKGAVLCDRDDVLMLWDGERSGLVAIGYTGVVGSTFAKLSPIDIIDSKYLFYFLDSKFHWIQGQRTGTGVPHVPKNLEKILWVKYPENKTEQQQIAKILSTADAVIEKTQATVAKYKAIKQGMLQDLLTYGLDKQNRRNKNINSQFYKPIKYFAKVRRGASPRPIDNPAYFGGDVGWIRISDVTQSFKYLNKTEQYVSPLGESLSVRVDKGDIIMSICGTVGKPVIIDIPACIHDGFVQLYDLKEVDIDFLYYSLQYHEENFLKKGQPGTQVNLNTTIVEDFIIYFPPIEEQKKIGKILNSIDNKLQTEQTYLQKMQSLKKGLMEDLLSGRKQVKVSEELVTQNEN